MPFVPQSTPPRPAYSVVVPFFNEEDGIAELMAELRAAVVGLERAGSARKNAVCEVILVNDGSTDRTGELLEDACTQVPGWRVVEMARNCGQAAALYAGIRLAAGERLILLDGDGQNHPADIPKVLALLEAGADLAVGIRLPRRDGWQRRFMSRLANAVRQRFLGDGVCDAGCGLKAMRREVADALIPLRTLYSFIPALAVGAGFRVAEIGVSHRPRRGGESKYGVRRFLIWPLLDMLGVCWFVHRRCPTGCLRSPLPNVVTMPVMRSEPALIKA